jgi:hypothetical protein
LLGSKQGFLCLLLSPLYTLDTTVQRPASMATGLEPFPLFIDSASPESAHYFSSSKMSASLDMLSSSKSTYRRPRISVPSKVSNYIRLRYYQYEVTFGLYIMSPTEKLILNSILFVVLSTLLYGLWFGLEVFIVRWICRLVYYIAGSVGPAGEFCLQQ